jgi:hypothetical protein
MQERQTRHASWQELLASPAAAPHTVQICDSDSFLVAGVAFFAAEGLRAGEAVLLTGTAAHWAGIRQTLASGGVDVDAALRAGQLAATDVQDAVAAVLPDGRLDPARFDAVAGEALRKARADARFTGVRWWGEMSNLMHRHGNTRDALRAEELADAVAKRHGTRLFCSYLLDRFDPAGYGGILSEVCCRHSHVIPAEDYVRHRIAVNRAVAEVVGEIRGALLQSLLSWKGLGCQLPSSQALLFWLREARPDQFEEVLSRVRMHHVAEAA